MCGSMVDIRSATAEIRRTKKKTEEETTGQNIMYASATPGDHNKRTADVPNERGRCGWLGAGLN